MSSIGETLVGELEGNVSVHEDPESPSYEHNQSDIGEEVCGDSESPKEE